MACQSKMWATGRKPSRQSRQSSAPTEKAQAAEAEKVPVKDVGQGQEAQQAVTVVQVNSVCVQEGNQGDHGRDNGAVGDLHALPGGGWAAMGVGSAARQRRLLDWLPVAAQRRLLLELARDGGGWGVAGAVAGGPGMVGGGGRVATEQTGEKNAG